MSEDVASCTWFNFASRVIFSAILFYWASVSLYYLWLHPLSKYPGPRLWAVSQIPWTIMFCSGQSHQRLLEIHNKYGAVVRIGPNELSFTAPEAWSDIMGRRKGSPENPKAPWYCPPQSKHIAAAPYDDHVRMRRVLSRAFTKSAQMRQEKLVIKYVGLLVSRLHELCSVAHDEIDIGKWFNFCSFDIIGDLAFGESFRCLEQSSIHPWIAMIFANLRVGAIGCALNRYPLFRVILPLLVPRKLRRLGENMRKFSEEKVSKRLKSKVSRPDFIEAMVLGKGDAKMTIEETINNAFVLTMAGSETTATALTGAMYLLATNPDVFVKLATEIRGSFKNDSSVNFSSVQQLPFLNAVINESLRLYPPGVNSQPRVTPSGGSRVLGQHIPANTVIGIPQRAMYLSESNFKHANEFIPERWLDDVEFSTDRRHCFNPFSVGPRNCIGMSLAQSEMKLVLALVVRNFDVQISEQSYEWLKKQRSYLHWDKTSLYVRLTPRPTV
ncbi:cytochrome P450 [Astrocystis sublimbata]|nr:cytochrome P450 [Astrocystis sublimbata]